MSAKYDADWDTFTYAMDGMRGVDQQRIAAEVLSLASTLLRKNADYGASAWTRPILSPGMNAATAILVRMSDKIERIRNLATSPQQVTSESLRDTMQDLAGYAVLWLAQPDGDDNA